MSGRITITRDGGVMLNSKATRWTWEPINMSGVKPGWELAHPNGVLRVFGYFGRLRSFLAELTDEELAA
jgi:hypothetical protein